MRLVGICVSAMFMWHCQLSVLSACVVSYVWQTLPVRLPHITVFRKSVSCHNQLWHKHVTYSKTTEPLQKNLSQSVSVIIPILSEHMLQHVQNVTWILFFVAINLLWGVSIGKLSLVSAKKWYRSVTDLHSYATIRNTFVYEQKVRVGTLYKRSTVAEHVYSGMWLRGENLVTLPSPKSHTSRIIGCFCG